MIPDEKMMRRKSTALGAAIAVLLTFLTTGLTLAVGARTARAQAIPELARWETQMVEWGRRHGAMLQDPNVAFDPKLAATYYDAQRVYLQIAEYTGDLSWRNYAHAAAAIYRDQYVIRHNGGVPGYWNFSHGLATDYLQTGNPQSRNAVLLLARNAAYAPDTTPISWTEPADLSREVAYTIQAYLNAERLGEPRRARLTTLVNQAFGHMDQWFVTRTAPYVRPFMVALTAEALIQHHKASPDPRTIPALVRAADVMWDTMWLPAAESFKYTDRVVPSGGTEPAPDLNLLIAPLYSFLYRETGATRFRDRGDAIFAGGVRRAYLAGPKQFNQSYRWSFQYVKDRSNSAPVNLDVSPASGAGAPGMARTLSACYSDPDGVADIGIAYIQIGIGSNTAQWGLYNASQNRLYLLSDDHSAWLGGFQPGSNNVISTGQGSLNCAATSVSRSGSTLTVNWSLTPPATWAGTTRNIYLYVEDRGRLYDGWDWLGTWTINRP
jgi:hypothetical protein